ncbi:Protein FAR1-RELATED SEQUENCE [Abeliophyllum distichum]|uniref:Protein FAR1-RELATED SEQUENCE n=1 Tax=Abeliophyllum distichum TaxID=126358 RepID=A0ABD1Q6H7_9LAMI
MSSNQRSESGHSFLKKYVDRKNSLTDFVTRFNRALVHQRHEELVANHIDLTQTPKNELVQSNSYICSKRSSSDEAKVYAIQRFEPGRTSDQTRQKKQVMLLPEKYILRRWTKNVKQARVFDPTTGSYVHTDPGHSLMSRHSMLSYAASDLVDEGSLTDARSTFLLSEFQNLLIRVKDINTGGDVGMSKNKNRSLEETQVVYDPHPVRAKGYGKRLKSGKEKVLSQSNRQCRACGTSGHDRRTCHTLQNRLDNTNQPQYSQDPSDQQYHTPDPQYAYHAPDPQYAYHAPDPQYAYHTPDPQYAYHAPDPQYAYHASYPQYSITGSNNASNSLDPWEYDARFNPRH